jgi:hypothetical protein
MASPFANERPDAVADLRRRLAGVEGIEDIPDGGLVCFLEHARWQMESAATHLREHLKWRTSNLPVPRSEVAQVLDADKVSVLDGLTSGGNPVLVLNFKQLMQADYTNEKELSMHVRATVYCAEEMIRRMPPGVNQWVALINCSGIMMPPTTFLNAFSQAFKANYPERVQTIVVYPVPTFVVRFVESMTKLLPERTRKKVTFSADLDGLCRELGMERELLSDSMATPASKVQSTESMKLPARERSTDTSRWTRQSWPLGRRGFAPPTR